MLLQGYKTWWWLTEKARDNSQSAGLGQPDEWKGHSPGQKIEEEEQARVQGEEFQF